jgi:hypothetical protein
MIARFKLKVSLCQITHAQTNKCHLYQMRYEHSIWVMAIPPSLAALILTDFHGGTSSFQQKIK